MTEPSTGRPKMLRQNEPGVAELSAPSSAPLPETVAVYRDGAETVGGRLPGDRYVRVRRRRSAQLPPNDDFHVLPGNVQPAPKGGVRRAVAQIKRVLIGRPLATADEPHERVNIFTGLAVFASDNI